MTIPANMVTGVNDRVEPLRVPKETALLTVKDSDPRRAFLRMEAASRSPRPPAMPSAPPSSSPLPIRPRPNPTTAFRIDRTQQIHHGGIGGPFSQFYLTGSTKLLLLGID